LTPLRRGIFCSPPHISPLFFKLFSLTICLPLSRHCFSLSLSLSLSLKFSSYEILGSAILSRLIQALEKAKEEAGLKAEEEARLKAEEEAKKTEQPVKEEAKEEDKVVTAEE
jgi:ATP-dependent RNA circularization protein (DNA/RNA ligase family)